MKNNISKKIIATTLLTLFSLPNLAAFSMENEIKPQLRDTQNEYSLKLKGDVSYITNTNPISMSMRDSDVKQVLRLFADKAGMNIIFHNSVEGTVTLDLVDVPLNTAFDMVMSINDLNYVVEDGKTIIVAKSGAQGFNFSKQDMTLIPVKYVSASAIADFLNKNIYSMNKPGLSNSEIVTTNPVTNELIVFGSKNDVAIAKKIVDKFDMKPKTTTFKVNHTTPAEMADMICKMLLPSTGSTTGTSTGGAAGVMTGAARSSSSDDFYGSSSGSGSGFSGGSGGGSASEVQLNAGTVACTLDGKMNGNIASLGLQNLSVAYYAQLGTINILGGSDQQLEMIKDFIAQTDKKQPQAYLEVSIVELTEQGSKELTNSWTVVSNSFSATFDGQSTYTDPLHPIFFKGNGFSSTRTSEGESSAYNVSRFSGPLNIAYAINYLIQNGKGRVVVNPRIIITNGMESVIEVTQDYLESVEIDSSTSTGGTVVTREYNIADDQGVTLSIMPFISPDGYVTLNIVPEYSTEIGQVDGEEEVEGQRVQYKAATLLSHRNLDLKNIRIKDGETLVIAGMIQERESKTIHKVPFLGDVPLIGALFRSTVSSKSKSEMVIMLTPKIITDNEDSIRNIDTL